MYIQTRIARKTSSTGKPQWCSSSDFTSAIDLSYIYTSAITNAVGLSHVFIHVQSRLHATGGYDYKLNFRSELACAQQAPAQQLNALASLTAPTSRTLTAPTSSIGAPIRASHQFLQRVATGLPTIGAALDFDLEVGLVKLWPLRSNSGLIPSLSLWNAGPPMQSDSTCLCWPSTGSRKFCLQGSMYRR